MKKYVGDAELVMVKAWFDSIVDAMKARNLGTVAVCAEKADLKPGLCEATIANYLVDACGIPMALDYALDAAVGPFMVGVYVGLKLAEQQRKQN